MWENVLCDLGESTFQDKSAKPQSSCPFLYSNCVSSFSLPLNKSQSHKTADHWAQANVVSDVNQGCLGKHFYINLFFKITDITVM